MEKDLTTTKFYKNKSNCPTCSKMLDAASGNGIPESGDISICIHCGSINIFKDDLSIDKLPEIVLNGWKITNNELYSQIMRIKQTIKENI